MIQVHVRDGIFNGGGYGGGVFDGTTMGFGGLGASGCGDSSGCGISGLGLSATPTYKWQAGDTGTSVAKALTGNGSRWTELATANPSHKCTQYGFCAKAGDVVTLPASWVSVAAPAAAVISADDVAFLVSVVNNMLFDMGLEPISGAITQVNAQLCGAADFVAKQVKAGNQLLQAQDVADFMGLATQLGALMGTLCAPLAPWPAPAKSTSAPPPAPVPTPSVVNPFVAIWASAGLNLASEAARLGHDPCLVRVSDAGSPVVSEMQRTMNALLQDNGFKPIPVNGNWDAQTCGALFALTGKWDPFISLCQIAGREDVGGWQVPAGCKSGVQPVAPTPVHPDEPVPGKKTGTTMAWMLGGLIGAAALTGLYVSMKHK
jgi:hypothetical protein